METKFFVVPFANAGDQAVVPDAPPSDGAVSYASGYGPDYSLNPEADPDAILVERREFNNILFSITASLAAIQSDYPQWITSSDNDGTPFPYKLGSVVRYVTDGNLYQSTTAANLTTPGAPGASWIIFGSQWALTAALTAEVARAQAAEALLAPINSPVFTGNPQAATLSPGTLGNFLATLSFVAGAVAAETNRAVAAEALLAPKSNPTFFGSVIVPHYAAGTNSGLVASTSYADEAVAVETNRASNAEALLAPLNSPALTGMPTAPTPPPGSDDSTIPNTSWVKALLAGGGASLVFRYAYLNIPVGGAFAVQSFGWNQPFPNACVAAVAGCHTNDVSNPFSQGNNWTAIAFGSTGNVPPDMNGGSVRIDNEQGKIVSANIGTSVIGIGF